MKHIFSIKKNLCSLLLSCVMTAFALLLTACGGPSAEKIAQAQDTYSNLVSIHNRVVSAHRQIEDEARQQRKNYKQMSGFSGERPEGESGRRRFER